MANAKKTKRNAAIRALKASGIKATPKNINIYMKENKSTKKRKKGKHKPSAAQVAKMRAGAKRYWAAKRGKPKRPMPLKVLKKHHARLGELIAKGGK